MQSREVRCKYWVGDIVHRRVDPAHAGLVLAVTVRPADVLYNVVFPDEVNNFMEMELCDDPYYKLLPEESE